MKRASTLGKPADKAAGAASPADHGGDLSRARALYGGAAGDWLDLSTGVNPSPYPIRPPAADSPVWRRLPDSEAMLEAAEAAREAYGAGPDAAVLPTPGAQGALQALPRILKRNLAEEPLVAILAPTYAEHARAFAGAGWRVEEVQELAQAEGAAAAVVVNPNNPDGRAHAPDDLLRLSQRVGALIVDESFIDETPGRSLAGACGGEGLIVLRSLGKFYGLAGLRLGFAIGSLDLAARLSAALGPWPVSGPALHFGAEALWDAAWAETTRRRLSAAGPRLRAFGEAAGLRPIGGTGLFQSFQTAETQQGGAATLQAALARCKIWTRIWPERRRFIRLGAPGAEADWTRLEAALREAAAELGARP